MGFSGTNSRKNQLIFAGIFGVNFTEKRCLLVSLTKFQDQFASVQQVINSSNSRDKFHKCCTDMYLICHFW